ncbi:MAG: hypothetical protein A2144_10295 [Chloroflexi bacterium RBG_16_50_9]|nr:MAG: hypothetical protein A2144_10295 [Chloroflexi bacterium RBG_16_50_9]
MQSLTFIMGLFIVIVCLAAAIVYAFFKPFINPELGDVVLFIFVMAGAVSGFIAGFGLRKLRAKS